MCDPISAVTLIGAGISAVNTITGALGQDQRSAETKKAALEAQRLENVALARRAHQEQRAATQTIMQADRQAREADALARVSAGEAGVAGASVDALLADIERDRLEFGTSVGQDLDDSQKQIELEKRGAAARAQNRINAAPPSDPLGTALKIGGAGLDAGSQYLSRLPQIRKQ
jgi:hypothetical protein